ncbi:hypothetical protein FOMPIDRAFT_94912 [Fomitopsis schrenkii]|uniref:Uncharacterized protein n=1 Tax=Fomitopsis schrenkii TaxID=2126942 RepID=S8DUA3_FOMSC|nr:hypothetical protein FOMPIDRAFT_94912 [Fomitopsis schrenkii]
MAVVPTPNGGNGNDKPDPPGDPPRNPEAIGAKDCPPTKGPLPHNQTPTNDDSKPDKGTPTPWTPTPSPPWQQEAAPVDLLVQLEREFHAMVD